MVRLERVAGLVAIWCLLAEVAFAQVVIPIREFAPSNISLAVARGSLRAVSQLPPVSNTGYSFEYDSDLGTYVSERDSLVSGMVPAARFSQKGTFSGVVSFAYFDLDEFAGKDSSSIIVSVPVNSYASNSPRQLVGIASSVSAKIYVVRLGLRYTILDQLDVGFNVPLMTVNATSRYYSQPLAGPGQAANFLSQGVNTPAIGGNVFFDEPLNQVDFPGGFNEGTNFDVGNVTLDTKYGFPIDVEGLALGVQVEVRLPTGNDARFTGTDSTGLRGLLIGSWQAGIVGLYMAGGYEYDFDTNILSNAMVGGSIAVAPYPSVLIELGANASFYDEDLDLYDSPSFSTAAPGAEVVGGNPFLGKNEASFGGGGRYNLFGEMVLSAYAGMPINDAGYRSSYIVSASLDYTF